MIMQSSYKCMDSNEDCLMTFVMNVELWATPIVLFQTNGKNASRLVLIINFLE